MARRPAATATPARTTPAQWPGVNHQVWIHLQLPDTLGGEEVHLPSRVEDAETDRLLLAAPSFRGDLHVVTSGLPVTVAWTGPRGRSQQDFLLAEVSRRGRVPVWDLAPCGEVRSEQRRRFARVPTEGLVVLHADPDDVLRLPEEDLPEEAEPTVPAGLVDLSEGGLRARVGTGTWVRRGRRAWMGFDLAGSPVVVGGQVVRVLPGPDATGDDVILAFHEPVAVADQIRRHVIRTQIERRPRGDQ